MQEEEEPRERKEPLQPWTHPLFQLPGLLSPKQHLVPGLLVGVCHQCVSVVRPQLREEQLSGRAGPGHVWGRAGAAGGQRGSCPEAGWAGAAPHPLPGLLQVVPQDFSNLLLLVLGECWQDALGRQVLGVDVPGTTRHRLGPQENSCDPGASRAGTEESHSGEGLGGWAEPQVLSVTLQLSRPGRMTEGPCSPPPAPAWPAPGWC